MKKRIEQLTLKLKTESGLFLKISFGVFLFILFFQPFPLLDFTFNNHLLLVSGMAGIIFLSLVAARTVLSWILREKIDYTVDPEILPPYLKSALIFIISTIAFIFYLRYVGSVKINFFITFKIILVCLLPPLILGINDKIERLSEQNELLISEKKATLKRIEKFEDDYLNKSIEFTSENINENFILHIAEVAFVKSAENYVEIVYKEGLHFKKKLIRNTLKNIEQQIKQYSYLVRCHRVCIINVHYVEKLDRINNNYWLSIKGLNEQLPVSRQYLLNIREALQG